MAHSPAPTPLAMAKYVAATIARRGERDATPIVLGAAQDWEAAGRPDLGGAIRSALGAQTS